MSHINRSISFGFAILFMLAGCGGSSGGSGDSGSSEGGVSGAVTTALATGTWKTPCNLNDEDPADIVNFIIEVIIDATTITGTVTDYDQADTTCTGISLAVVGLDPLTYILGGDVTVDGSVAGITTATKIDTTDLGPPIEIDYDLIAISNNKLYLGNTDGVNDGTSDALRPTQLDSVYFFTRQ